MPGAMPSEFTVCSTLEAEPISCGLTPAITMSNSGTNTMPIPIPPTIIGASRSTVEVPPPMPPQHGLHRDHPAPLDHEPGVQAPAPQLAHRDAARRRADERARRP